jgi:hypothetical protein
VMDTGPKVLCSERRSAEMLAVSMQGSRRDVRAFADAQPQLADLP